MTILYSSSYYETEPTIDDVKREICGIVGLPEIKSQLEAIVETIRSAETQYVSGIRVVPPKPFNMVFVGNTGTGKSMVARIVGKLFYLAGSLSCYTVTEMTGLRYKITEAKGGVLLVDVDERGLKSQLVEEIVSLIDEGETLVIFSGHCDDLNECMQTNKQLYGRFSLTLTFDDLSCEELAVILRNKINDDNEEDEDSLTRGLRLHPDCNSEMLGKIIAERTCGALRSKLNGYLVDQIIIEARNSLEGRMNVGNDIGDRKTLTMADFEAGVHNAAQVYMKVLGVGEF